mmetsp:Transcript_14086/g.24491  ORF Transcript_14086/g.24491 Transcript_14086/m.24491 type:complete len:120 (+) Transcript_14086:59-418(+)
MHGTPCHTRTPRMHARTLTRTHARARAPRHATPRMHAARARSALDADSEFLVQEAIDQMIAVGDMTVLIIAHRLSTIQKADSIAVVCDGRVVEQGTHGQLLSAQGTYASLVKRQQMNDL